LFEECAVPRANVLGEAGKATGRDRNAERRTHRDRRARSASPRGARSHHRYIRERKQFGKAIAEFRPCSIRSRAPRPSRSRTLDGANAARLRDRQQPFLTEAAMCRSSSEVAERVLARRESLRRLRIRQGLSGESCSATPRSGRSEGTSNLQLQTIAKQILG
jgi:alkylation response protein AidB-like acyl-CoA dehydrogenase